jgi:hypothetical protein
MASFTKAIAIEYGKDSVEYKKAGGSRTSERKPRKRKKPNDEAA